MRVNITYSVDLEETPQCISKLIKESTQTLVGEDVVGSLQNVQADLQKAQISTSTLEKIKKVRENLAKIDVRLLECANILKGYEKAILNIDEPSSEINTNDAEND